MLVIVLVEARLQVHLEKGKMDNAMMRSLAHGRPYLLLRLHMFMWMFKCLAEVPVGEWMLFSEGLQQMMKLEMMRHNSRVTYL